MHQALRSMSVGKLLMTLLIHAVIFEQFACKYVLLTLSSLFFCFFFARRRKCPWCLMQMVWMIATLQGGIVRVYEDSKWPPHEAKEDVLCSSTYYRGPSSSGSGITTRHIPCASRHRRPEQSSGIGLVWIYTSASEGDEHLAFKKWTISTTTLTSTTIGPALATKATIPHLSIIHLYQNDRVTSMLMLNRLNSTMMRSEVFRGRRLSSIVTYERKCPDSGIYMKGRERVWETILYLRKWKSEKKQRNKVYYIVKNHLCPPFIVAFT